MNHCRKEKDDHPIMKYLLPDYYFKDIYSITPQLLCKLGIKAVILDIDNTLVTYDDPVPTESVWKWLKELEAADIKISFVSNNNEERCSLFNRDLGYFYSSDSKKPSPKQALRAMEHMNTTPDSTAVIGDQLFTDVLSGKRIGLTAFLVDPIKDKISLLFKFKRFFERIILKKHKSEISCRTDKLSS